MANQSSSNKNPSGSMGSTSVGTQQQNLVSYRGCVNSLRDAIKNTGPQSDTAINNAIAQLKKCGDLNNLGKWAQDGSSNDAKRVFDDIVSTLRQAADLGNNQARGLLRQIQSNSNTQSGGSMA